MGDVDLSSLRIALNGAEPIDPDAVEVLITRLLPLATVVTPNLYEAEALAGSASAATSRSGRRTWLDTARSYRGEGVRPS